MYCIPLKGLCFDKLILCLNFISIVFIFKICSYWCVCVTSSWFLLNRADESFTNCPAFIGSKVGTMIDVECLTVLVNFFLGGFKFSGIVYYGIYFFDSCLVV